MTRQFQWKRYIVQITKRKNMKRMTIRMKPGEPNMIYVSIPYSVSCETVLSELENPRFLQWLENQQEKSTKQPAVVKDWYEERKSQVPLYGKRLQELLPAMFAKWEARLGVKVNKVTIRDTRSQWGSCNVSNHNISISIWLGAYPPECVEYIVVHELVHLLERGHSARFYAYLDQHYPEWKECEKKLKKGALCQ